MKEKLNAHSAEAEKDLSFEQKYLHRFDSFSKFYAYLIAAESIAVAAAVAVAVLSDVLLGIALSILCASVYVYLTTDELYKKLGLRYKNLNGSVRITRAVARYSDSIVIPSRLIFADVTAIDDGAFDSPKNSELSRIFIPKSVKYIGANIFSDSHGALSICYEGSSDEWSGVEKKTSFENVEIIFNCDLPALPPKQKKKRKDSASPEKEAEL